MSEIEFDDSDMDFEDYDDSAGEDFEYEGEDYDAESRQTDRARRDRLARQRRRIGAARRRLALQSRTYSPRVAMYRPSTSVRATPQQAVSAIRNLDLESKVQEDTFRRALSNRDRRMNRSEYSSVLSAASSQYLESFDKPKNQLVRAVVRFAPLLMLSPQRRGNGFGGLVKDPRTIGGLLVFGIAAAGTYRDGFWPSTRQIVADRPKELASGGNDKFVATVVERNGRIVPNAKLEWDSKYKEVATIDNDGNVAGHKPGNAVIVAKVDGVVVQEFRLKVN